MRFGFGVLGLSSRDFWGLTPKELAAAAEGLFGEQRPPLDRAALDGMIARYPDEAGG
jgi:uncharacterized phage protein (TIGR02216 family)